ncbi:helix-turn-helix transcriptional regulator [Archangium sp.]|uniref:helix-turn-helix transcriptional regulator n=1 Tax=Archangium sp. TaxID=1872627 RepID=UPI002D5B937A|nr:helix-turn-helix transcriptional regulator [Archangium sp.]HYO53292.1 helix-turn-helix transcriptional regulator [Archangium sp.]
MDMPNLNSREQALIFKILDAFSSSLDFTEVFSQAQGPMSQLFPSDSMALCVSKPGQPTAYDWMAPGMPVQFFERYHEVAKDDFVRSAVARTPDVVLRDEAMIPRAELVRNPVYWRFRELGMPLEHCMSVLLSGGPAWHCGVTMYRGRRRPFSKRNQAILQWLAPRLVTTIRNCRMFGEVSARGEMLDALFHKQGAALLVMASSSKEVMRTERATELLDAWFPLAERDSSGLPTRLVEHLTSLMSGGGDLRHGRDVWRRTESDRSLKVTFVQLPVPDGRRLWMLVLEERPHAIPLPEDWHQELTAREVDVATYVLHLWDGRTIADHLGCSLGTVKQHLKHIFDKLGTDNQKKLISLALRS